LGNSPLFINIKRYCWWWSSSQFFMNYFSFEIQHIICCQELLSIFENHSVFWWISMILLGAMFCCSIWASGIFV
jgi:hypothetical protein